MDGKAHKRHDISQYAFAAAAHSRLIQRLIGLPKLIGLHAAETVARLLDGLGKFLDLVITQALFIRTAIKDLQGRDLVFVGFNELLKRLYQSLSAVTRVAVKASVGDCVLADGVNDLLIAFADFNEAQAQLGIADDGTRGVIQQLFGGGRNFFRRWLRAFR